MSDKKDSKDKNAKDSTDNKDAKEEGDDKAKNPEGGEEGAKEGEEGAAEKPASGKRKKLIIVAIIVVVLLLIAGGVVFFLEKKHIIGGSSDAAAAAVAASKPPAKPAPIYIDMEEFIVNLQVDSKQPSFIKLTISLEVPTAEDQATVNEFVPSLRDSAYFYLRSLRPEDLQGSAGMYKLKEQLLLRANKIVYPAIISDVLFKEIIVQ